MKYKLRRGVGVPADVVGGELKRIAAAHGKITPEIVIDEARAEGAPLHAAFTWDNDAAAEQFRLIEARTLIRAVVIVENGEDRGSAYVHVRATEDDESGAYHPVAKVVANPDMFAAAVQGLVAKLEAAQGALADLQQAAARGRSARPRKRAVGKAQRLVTEAKEALESVA